jgi:hypothetical protein
VQAADYCHGAFSRIAIVVPAEAVALFVRVKMSVVVEVSEEECILN